MNSARILFVDGDEAEAVGAVAALVVAGYSVLRDDDAFSALVAVEEAPPDLVVLAWDLPFINGAVFARALRAGFVDPPPVVALVGEGCRGLEAVDLGVTSTVPRPLDIAALTRAVAGALRTGRKHKDRPQGQRVEAGIAAPRLTTVRRAAMESAALGRRD